MPGTLTLLPCESQVAAPGGEARRRARERQAEREAAGPARDNALVDGGPPDTDSRR